MNAPAICPQCQEEKMTRNMSEGGLCFIQLRPVCVLIDTAGQLSVKTAFFQHAVTPRFYVTMSFYIAAFKYWWIDCQRVSRTCAAGQYKQEQYSKSILTKVFSFIYSKCCVLYVSGSLVLTDILNPYITALMSNIKILPGFTNKNKKQH